MRAALLIAAKDLTQRLRDRSAIMLGIIAPLGLAFIFSLIIPDTSEDFTVELGIADEDGGAVAREVVAQLAGIDVAVTTIYADRTELLAAVEQGDVEAGLAIPDGFTAGIQTDDPGAFEVIAHADRPTAAQITESIASSFAGRLTAARVAAATALVTGAGDPAAVAAAAGRASPIITLDDEVAGSKQLGLSTFFAAGMAIFFLFFTVQFGVSSLLEERTNGTMPRLLAAPIQWWHIVAGKGLAAFALGLVAMTVLIVASTLFIDASWGDSLGVALLVVTAVLSALGIMAVIATLARTAEQAANWQAIVAVVLGMLGGTFFPVSQGPELLASLSLLTPHAWFMRGLGDLANGGGMVDAAPAALAMVIFFVVTLAIAATRIKRMVAA